MTFRDQTLNSMTFQALKMKFLNSMTFQVFQDLYKPCTNSEWDENLKNCLPSLASCKAEVYQYKAVVQATTFFTHLLYLGKFCFACPLAIPYLEHDSQKGWPKLLSSPVTFFIYYLALFIRPLSSKRHP